MQCSVRSMAETKRISDTLPKKGKVTEVCKEWLVHEDGALAYALQQQEVEKHYHQNKSRNAVLREDFPLALNEQKREYEDAVARYQKEVIQQEEKDAAVARRLAEEYASQEEIRRARLLERDSALAHQIQEKIKTEPAGDINTVGLPLPGPRPPTVYKETKGAEGLPRVEHHREEWALRRHDRITQVPLKKESRPAPPGCVSAGPSTSPSTSRPPNPLHVVQRNDSSYAEIGLATADLLGRGLHPQVYDGTVVTSPVAIAQGIPGLPKNVTNVSSSRLTVSNHQVTPSPAAICPASDKAVKSPVLCTGAGAVGASTDQSSLLPQRLAVGFDPKCSNQRNRRMVRTDAVAGPSSSREDEDAISVWPPPPSTQELDRHQQELQDEELARQLQEALTAEDDQESRDRAVAIEAQDLEIAKMLQDKERAKARRAREKAKAKALARREAEVSSSSSTAAASTPPVAEETDEIVPAQPEGLVAGVGGSLVPNIAAAIDPTFSRPARSPSSGVDLIRASPHTTPPHPPSYDEEDTTIPYFPVQGQKRTSSLDKKKKNRSKDTGCKQQ